MQGSDSVFSFRGSLSLPPFSEQAFIHGRALRGNEVRPYGRAYRCARH